MTRYHDRPPSRRDRLISYSDGCSNQCREDAEQVSVGRTQEKVQRAYIPGMELLLHSDRLLERRFFLEKGLVPEKELLGMTRLYPGKQINIAIKCSKTQKQLKSMAVKCMYKEGKISYAMFTSTLSSFSE